MELFISFYKYSDIFQNYFFIIHEKLADNFNLVDDKKRVAEIIKRK